MTPEQEAELAVLEPDPNPFLTLYCWCLERRPADWDPMDSDFVRGMNAEERACWARLHGVEEA
jgi:hypothetical protein